MTAFRRGYPGARALQKDSNAHLELKHAMGYDFDSCMYLLAFMTPHRTLMF